MSVILKIGVLISTGVHPVSGATRYCRNDALGLALGLQLAEAQSAQLEVFHAGEPNNSVLSEYLALGAPRIQVVPTDADEDAMQNLAVHLTKTDLILTGTRAECAESSGLLPYLLADKLGLPIITNVLEIKPIENGLEVLQFLPKGKRRRVCMTLPAVVVVHPLVAVELNYAHARQVTGKIEVLAKPDKKIYYKSIGYMKIPIMHKPTRLKAMDKKYGINKTGFERMTEALVVESKNGFVVIEQNSVEKSQVILRYLREHHLVDF